LPAVHMTVWMIRHGHKEPTEVGAGLRPQRVGLIKPPLARLAFGKCCTHAVKP